MAAPVKLTQAEALALVSALEQRVGYDQLLAVLIAAIGAQRALALVEEKAGRITKAETVVLVKAILPLVPGADLKAKVKSAIAGLREAIPDKARADAILAYVLERIKRYKAVPALASDYPDLGSGTVTGYGPVNNHWKIPDSTIRRILDRMQQKTVRTYKVESVGHASEDVLGRSNLLAQMKAKTLFSAAECAKRGILYHATLFNDNAGKNTWKNSGYSLGDRLKQAKAFIDWFAATVPPQGVYVVIVGETRTSAGKELEKYGAAKLKAAGFKIGNNNGSRPQATASFGGIQTDFHEYHPTKTSDWPTSKAAHVTSDTGAILAQLNQGGNVYGLGNPAAVTAWRAAGVAKGYAFIIFYGFDVAEYDEPTIDAMAGNSTGAEVPASGNGAISPSQVRWLGTDYSKAKTTVTLSGATKSGKHLNFKASAISWPPQGAKKCKAVGFLIRQIGGQYVGGKVEWCVVERGWYDIATNTATGYNGATMPKEGETCWAGLGHPTHGRECSTLLPFSWRG